VKPDFFVVAPRHGSLRNLSSHESCRITPRARRSRLSGVSHPGTEQDPTTTPSSRSGHPGTEQDPTTTPSSRSGAQQIFPTPDPAPPPTPPCSSARGGGRCTLVISGKCFQYDNSSTCWFVAQPQWSDIHLHLVSRRKMKPPLGLL
jgi:hypothetical protein